MINFKFLDSLKKSFVITFSILFTSGLMYSQNWEQLSNSPFYTDHSNGFGWKDRAFVIKGTPDSGRNQLWEYMPDGDTWTYLKDFPGQPREIAIGDEWNGKYYFGFGNSGGNGLNDLWEFNPVDTSFVELPSCPCPGRSHPALIAHNDQIMMGSGSGDQSDLDDWWKYDMITQEWTRKANMPGGIRHHPFFFAIENKVYVGGGHIDNWLEYDLESEQWLAINNTPEGRVAGTQLEYDGLGLIVAGDDRVHNHIPTSETFMSYNPETDTWDYLPTLPMGSKWAPTSFIIEDVLYFFGGINYVVQTDATMWKFNLNFLKCRPATQLNAVNISDVEAGLVWNESSIPVDTLKWREKGEDQWNTILNPDAVYTLTELNACTEYEFQVSSQCEDVISASSIFNFITDGCCTNPELTSTNITPTSAEIIWPDILAANEYQIRWRAVDDNNWTETSTSGANYNLSALEECTEYEFQIQSLCATDVISFSESYNFLTANCGPCLDIEYCGIPDDLNGEIGYINEVQVNNFVNTTGSDGGYGNYGIPTTELISVGESFSLSVETVDDIGILVLSAWIDYDGDGQFSETERVVFEEFLGSIFTTTISVPSDAIAGLTRMRIQLSANFSTPSPCEGGSGFAGEVEDYCIELSSTSGQNEISLIELEENIYPNPVLDMLYLKDYSNINKATIYNLAGQSVISYQGLETRKPYSLHGKESGIYILKTEFEDGTTNVARFIKL